MFSGRGGLSHVDVNDISSPFRCLNDHLAIMTVMTGPGNTC